MNVNTIYDPTPEIAPPEHSRPEKGRDNGIDDFDDRVPN